jgi:hypothetical protein
MNEPRDGMEYFLAVTRAGDYRQDRNCPVCDMEDAFGEGGAWEICRRCGWEDDPSQRDNPDSRWGPNKGVSLSQARDLVARLPMVKVRRILFGRDPETPCPEIDQ